MRCLWIPIIGGGSGGLSPTESFAAILKAIGNWAERNGIGYSSYQELAGHPRVLAVVENCVEKVNADLAADSHLAGSQIQRFLILHKELDPDDGELTRTRKVRRRFIAERYGRLVDARPRRSG